jgi:hypothetical protein
MKDLYFIFILVLLILGCNKSYEPFQNDIDLNGTWQETFHTFYIKQISIPEDSTNIVELDRVTTLTIKNGSFQVETLPHVTNMFGYIDSIYSGNLSIKQDTLYFILDNQNETKKLIFNLSGDVLNLKIATKILNNGLVQTEISSFIWGGSNKTSGYLKKINN